MKKILCLITMLFIAGSIQAKELECRIELEPFGVHYTYCPPGSLMDANRTRVNIVNRSVFVDDRVRCVKPKIVCDKDPEKIDKDFFLEDN